jgi:hypothetical protein
MDREDIRLLPHVKTKCVAYTEGCLCSEPKSDLANMQVIISYR